MSLVTELKISRQDTQLLCAQISDKGDKPSEDFGTHWQSSAIFFFFFFFTWSLRYDVISVARWASEYRVRRNNIYPITGSWGVILR